MSERQVPRGVAELMRKRRDADSNAITVYDKGTALEKVTPDEVLDVSWSEVRRALENAIISIEHEGGLEDAQVEKVLLIVSVALRELAGEQESVRRALERLPKNSILTYLQAVIPGKPGSEARTAISERWQAEKNHKDVDAIATDIRAGRLVLAEAIDTGVHNKLLHTNEAYRDLEKRDKGISAEHKLAQSILSEVEEWIKSNGKDLNITERSDLHKKISPRWEELYRTRNCQPAFVEGNLWPEQMISGITTYIANCESDVNIAKGRMQHLRDEEKTKIYSKRSTQGDK